MHVRRGSVLLILSLAACASRQAPAPGVATAPPRALATAYEADLTGL